MADSDILGIPTAAWFNPDLYVQQQAIARKQALASALLGSQPSQGAYGGLSSAGRNILGAILTNRSTHDLSSLYSGLSSGMMGGNMPQQQPQAQPQQPMGPGQTDAEGTPMASYQPQQAPQQPQMQQPQGTQQGIPRAANFLPQIPGMSPLQSFMMLSSSPQSYWTAVSPTPEYRNALVAAGGNEQAAQRLLMAKAIKDATITGRAGNMMVDPSGNESFVPPQASPGYRYIKGVDGNIYEVPIAGGAQAVAAASTGQASGPATFNVQPTYTPTRGPNGSIYYAPGQTSAAQMGMAAGGNPLISGANLPAMHSVESNNNPNAISPAGAMGLSQVMPATAAQPGFGVQPATPGSIASGQTGDDYLQSLISHYGNATLGHIAYNWGPGKTDAWLKRGGDWRELPLQTQYYLGRIATAQAVPQQGQPIGPQTLNLPPGAQTAATTYAGKVASAPGDEYSNTKAAASDVQTRMDVLRHIYNISKLGAPTGSPEWMNQARQDVAALAQQAGANIDPNSPAALMGWIHKYMQQYSSRMAEGGNETDAKRVSAELANPNLDMFPATLQKVVPWIMANEAGLKAKANFYDANMAGNENNPSAGIAVQAQWRNTYEPRVAQFEMMTPQQQAGYLADPRAFRSPQDRIAFIQAAKALHPYFKGAQGGRN